MSPDGNTESNGVYRDFMRQQGVVRFLTQMLRQELSEASVRPEQILETLGALQMLLSSSAARAEFLRLGGYRILANFLSLCGHNLGDEAEMARLEEQIIRLDKKFPEQLHV